MSRKKIHKNRKCKKLFWNTENTWKSSVVLFFVVVDSSL